MQDLTLALIQADLAWEDKRANLARFQEKLESLAAPADIILLPEMFTTGFSMQPEGLAETMQGDAVAWMLRMAAARDAVVTGSLIIEENGAYFNRLIWAQPDGSLQWYNKRHLFSMAGEEQVYYPGSEKLCVEWRGWKICPMICYDLRFPVWIRNVEEYDLLLFVANWPDRRVQHWRKLLQARAIENQCYAAGVNRVGADGNGILHSGSSMVVNPQGDLEADSPDGKEEILITVLKREQLTFTRRYMPFLKDRDSFKLL